MKIDRYNPVIYPRKLWVVVGWSDEIYKKFLNPDRTELAKREDCNGAVTFEVCERNNSRYFGVVIALRNNYKKTSECGKDITHESGHAANFFFAELGIKPDVENDEPQTYLQGWIAECCWKTVARELDKLEFDT